MDDAQNRWGNEFGDLKRDRMVWQVAKDAPSKVNAFRKVYSGNASPRQAIKALCIECCWMDERAIRECTSTACHLWAFRPYQERSKDEE